MNTPLATVAYNICTKWDFNRIRSFDANVFTHMFIMITMLSLYRIGPESNNNNSVEKSVWQIQRLKKCEMSR